MEKEYNGKCPLCSGQLYKDVEILRCGKGHYQIECVKFERRWKDYMMDVAALEKRNSDKELNDDEFISMKGEQINQLLQDLQESNLRGAMKTPYNPKAEYIDRCAAEMLRAFGRPIKIMVTEKANPSNYPVGAWFDDQIGQVLEPAGVDNSSIPKQYIMPNGDGIPFAYARVIDGEL